MSKFHINPNTGAAGRCRAFAGECPFGGESDHYGSAEKARNAFEARMGGSFAPPSLSPLPARKVTRWNREEIALTSEHPDELMAAA